MTAKRKWLIALAIALPVLMLGGLLGGLYAMQSGSFHTGRCIVREDGGILFIDEDGSPIVLSDNSVSGDLFEGLQTGDKIRVQYDVVAESYPGQASTAYCQWLGGGSIKDIPEATRRQLAEMGWISDAGEAGHDHEPAGEPQTVADPVTGYCGNIVATLSQDGRRASFTYDDAVTLTDILINLDYAPDNAVCQCEPELTAELEWTPSTVEISLIGAFARCDKGQCALTAEQVETIRGIAERQLN